MLIRNFDQVLESHFEYRENLISDLKSNLKIDSEKYKNHTECDFGKWLKLLKHDSELINIEIIEDLVIKHKRFHKFVSDLIFVQDEKKSEEFNEFYDGFIESSDELTKLFEGIKTTLREKFPEKFNILNESVVWDKSKDIFFKVDKNLNLLYANEIFYEVTGYSELEIIQQSVKKISHPDMPKIIVRRLIKSINDNETQSIITKNLSKSGKYFWVKSDLQFNSDNSGKITTISITQKGLYNKIIEDYFEPLYNRLKQIELKKDIASSERFLELFLGIRKKTYTQYIDSIIKDKSDFIGEKKPKIFKFKFNF